MLYIHSGQRGNGYGQRLMAHWEADMKARGYGILLTSTQADETAQHFYRKIGYKDCGALLLGMPHDTQPTELFLIKAISGV